MIAEKVGLSSGTVSFVLNGRGDDFRISRKTQELINETARDLGYRPNVYARRLKGKMGSEKVVIGLFWPSTYSADLLTRFFDGVQTCVLNEVPEAEIILKPFTSSRLDLLEDSFSGGFFNGGIIVGAADEDYDFVCRQARSMSIVFWHRQNDKFSSVCVDDYIAGEKVAKLFAARGHARAGIVDSENVMRHRSMRRLGFVDGCAKYGIDLPPESISRSPIDPASVRSALEKLLGRREPPTALFFTIGRLAINAYPALRDLGVAVPGDAELVAFGDTELNTVLSPSLTVIDLPVQRMVARCLRLVVSMVSGAVRRPVTIFEESYFIFRESCGGFPGDAISGEDQ
jgi:DNA-binding LacI/PurR family transcriptional regulator